MHELASDVKSLVAAVRARLWRDDGLRLARRTAWASAAVLLVVVVAHLVATSVGVEVALALVGALWLATLGGLAARRPSDAASALWIDRRLGGASAFTTLLDASSHASASSDPDARRRLERWAAARAPDAMRALAVQRTAPRIAPSLLSMAVCIVLAVVVLTLPETGATFRHAAAAKASSGATEPDRRTAAPAPVPERGAATQLASNLSSALRPTESPADPEQRRTPSSGPAEPDRRAGEPGPASSAASGDASSSRAPAASAPSASSSATTGVGTLQASEKVSGRAAGDSPDARADVGVSRGASGTMTVKRIASRAALAQDRQADMAKAGSFDDGSAEPGASARSALDVAAATPPPATDTARLSPAEAHYVEAWMKASGRTR